MIVSGCPRSGTSLTMDLIRTAIGEDKIIGSKFPKDAKLTPAEEYQRDKLRPGWRSDARDAKDMNPNGFWECAFSVQGIRYIPSMLDAIERIRTGQAVVKVVSQGLANTDPYYVDKIIFLLRHPRAVAKSQERLKHVIDTSALGEIHTPRMFITVTTQFAAWQVRHNKPLLLVNYDELIDNPQTTVAAIRDFVGIAGDWDAAAACVDPTLKRSTPQAIENPLWEDAVAVYERALVQDWQGIVDYMRNDRQTHREGIHFYCPRRGLQTAAPVCKQCQKPGAPIVARFIQTAMARDIDWADEPCLWDVEYNPDFEGVRPTIEESKLNNHWIQPEAPAP